MVKPLKLSRMNCSTYSWWYKVKNSAFLNCFRKTEGKIMDRKDNSYNIRIILYYTLIISVASYASESWILKREDIQRSSIIENNWLRVIATINIRSRIRMTAIRKTLDVKTDKITTIRRKINWFDCVIRRGEWSLEHRSYKERLPWQMTIW